MERILVGNDDLYNASRRVWVEVADELVLWSGDHLFVRLDAGVYETNDVPFKQFLVRGWITYRHSGCVMFGNSVDDVNEAVALAQYLDGNPTIDWSVMDAWFDECRVQGEYFAPAISSTFRSVVREFMKLIRGVGD